MYVIYTLKKMNLSYILIKSLNQQRKLYKEITKMCFSQFFLDFMKLLCKNNVVELRI